MARYNKTTNVTPTHSYSDRLPRKTENRENIKNPMSAYR